MSLIGILIGIAFFCLLAQAILETIWGTCLIIHGICCHILAAFLEGLALLLTGFYRVKRVLLSH